MELDEEAVWQALERLRGRGMVARVLPAPGARAERFRHELREALDWGARQQAIMAELLLRGPQTVGELRGRCARMHEFESLDVVTQTLNDLAARLPSCVGPLPREPGRSAIRYGHRLHPEGEGPAVASARASGPIAPPLSASTARRSTETPVPIPSQSVASQESRLDSGEAALLREELENMQAELADMHQDLSALRRRLDTLEARQM
jgi:hypothetical protein